MIVRDYGTGFDRARVDQARLGLRRSITERIADCGGQAAIWSEPGRGTAVRLSWPAPAPAAEVPPAEVPPPRRPPPRRRPPRRRPPRHRPPRRPAEAPPAEPGLVGQAPAYRGAGRETPRW